MPLRAATRWRSGAAQGRRSGGQAECDARVICGAQYWRSLTPRKGFGGRLFWGLPSG